MAVAIPAGMMGAMMAVSAATAAAGAAMSAMGAIAQGNAQKQASQYNAALQERSARIALEQSQAEADRVRRLASRVQGSMLAGFGGSGLTIEDSAIDALGDSASQSELDVQIAKYHGKLQAMGYESNAVLDRMQGRVAQQQGYARAASEALTGIGRGVATYAAGTRRIGDSYVAGLN